MLIGECKTNDSYKTKLYYLYYILARKIPKFINLATKFLSKKKKKEQIFLASMQVLTSRQRQNKGTTVGRRYINTLYCPKIFISYINLREFPIFTYNIELHAFSSLGGRSVRAHNYCPFFSSF
jgi:hypothetical protein